MSFLDFEQPIAELEAKIDELRFVGDDAEINISDEIERLRAKSQALTTQHLLEPDVLADHAAGAAPAAALHARLPRRRSSPTSRSCTATACSRTTRRSSAASAGSTARPVMVIGQQKGRDTKERVRRNFGMPKPEGYRKALRLMQLAERFRCRSSR